MLAPVSTTSVPIFQDAEDSSELKRLRSPNTVWAEQAHLWKFYLAAYEGGDAFACRENLFKHTRENDEDFVDRCNRIHNLNYCEPLVDFFTNFIFSETIDRDGGSNTDFYKTFIKDVNKKGDGIDDFMREVCTDMQIFGMVYILEDAPVITDEVVTVADQNERGIRPYWVLIKPDEVIDWLVDDFGKYVYVKRRQNTSEIVGGTFKRYEKYTEFYESKIVTTKVDVTDPKKPVVEPASEVDNTLGKIPIVVARYKRSKTVSEIGLSFLRDLAGNNRQVLNLTSLLDEFLYRQAFNILAKEAQDSVPLKEQEEGVVGTANVLEYPAGAKAPAYISPPVAPAQFIKDERSSVISEMFKRAAQDTMSEMFNGEKSSGFSQSQSFSRTVPFIASRADTLEKVENELMALTMERMNKTWDGKIKYKDRYEITNLTDALTQLLMIFKDFMFPSETFAKEELKRIFKEFDGKLPSDISSKIVSEIEKMDFNKWRSDMRSSLIGKSQGTTSPTEQQKPKGTGTMQEMMQEARVETAATTKLRN